MVHELAEFEQATDKCHLTEDQLTAALFGDHPAVFGHVAVADGGEPIGMALWFVNFSTWEGTHGLYLEDLYVRPAARGTGAGGALLAALAAVCVERGYRRMEWVMLDWNPAAEFYAAIGATVIADWLPYRLTGPALSRLAERASRISPVSG
jgi:GNAT superfamily N-acetyltransferase